MPPLILHHVKTAFLDLFFPLRCINCGSEGSLICPSCQRSLPTIEPPFCRRCGTRISEGSLCTMCISHPLTIDGIRSLFLFEGIARHAIRQFKYHQLKTMASPLAHLLAEYLRSNPLPGDAIIPVPLHSKQLKRRGYNQAALLATEIGKLTGLPVTEGLLIRLRDTQSQTKTTSAAERRENVRDAFSCPQRLHRENIVLIDDV